MITLISEKIPKILKSKKILEEKLNVKISNNGKEITIEGTPEDEYIAEQIIEAINLGFQISTAIAIKKEDFIFEKINIKNYTNSKNLERVRGRIIGKGGKALKNLSLLTKCRLSIDGNKIGIIGEYQYVKNAKEAIISLARGSKHGNVYAFLEKNHPLPIFDLGLKEMKKK